ncbi:GIY-YIG nuclease family protein [Corallococcus llansteffanensis]|uniref:GIY-YIG nuclease family protein n=2 Tax=Corallococcus llansteffanensis TaxID=2316731 RepID=A0A3A8QKD9_9BACT|nr:GIY-YIG nuclease family protein [Corallococcus llansteffanensis]
MSAGYVYILINSSMNGLIKIGRTLRDSRSRARELYTTGVPTSFEVAFEVFSERHEELELAIHARLADFRINSSREFFRYPLNDAIKILQQLHSPGSQPDLTYSAESIFHRLKEKYPGCLRSEISDVRIVQTNERVWLEITEEEERAGYLKDQTIKRADLAFISDDIYDKPMFKKDDNVSENARKFVEEFDSYSIACTTSLFNDETFYRVREEHHSKQGDKSREN